MIGLLLCCLILTSNYFDGIKVYAVPAACTAGGTTIFDHDSDPACTGKIQYRIIYKSISCPGNTADFEVQVKSDAASPQPIMGDYNIRIQYDSTVMTRIGVASGSLVAQNNYSNGVPASDTSYAGQNLNGSVQNATSGVLSINGFFGGLPGTIIPSTFTTVSTIRMNIVNPAAPLNMDMNDASSFPTTGNNVVFDDGTGSYDQLNPAYETANIDLAGSTKNLLCAPQTSSSSSLSDASSSQLTSNSSANVASSLTSTTSSIATSSSPIAAASSLSEVASASSLQNSSSLASLANSSLISSSSLASSSSTTSSLAISSASVLNSSSAATSSVALVADNDGVNTTVENAAPNNGDANKDGVLDSLQGNVASLVDKGATPKYVVVSADPTSLCQNLENLSTNTEIQNITLDSIYDYPVGLVNFTSPCATSIKVKMYWYGLDTTKQYINRKFNPVTNIYSDVAGVASTIENVNGVPVLTYTVNDNGPLDTNPAIGTITDPIGPVLAPVQFSNGGVITVGNQSSSVASVSSSSSSSSSTVSSSSLISSSSTGNESSESEDSNLKATNTIRTGGNSLDLVIIVMFILSLGFVSSVIEKPQANK